MSGRGAVTLGSPSVASPALLIVDPGGALDQRVSTIEQLGYATHVAYGGHAGLEALRTLNPAIVILDCWNSDLDPVAWVKIARVGDHSLGRRVVACVPESEPALQGIARRAGIGTILSLPTSPLALAAALAQARGRGASADAGLERSLRPANSAQPAIDARTSRLTYSPATKMPTSPAKPPDGPEAAAAQRLQSRVPVLSRTDPRRLAPGHLLADRFRVLRRLGSGSMASVYAVRDEHLAEDVALKILEALHVQDAHERFRRESKLARRIVHPNVVRTLDAGLWKGRPYLTMDLLEGQSLADLLRDPEWRMPLPDVARIGHEIAEGLGAIHAHGVAHRDLSTSNVFIERAGTAKILDFGSARPPADPMGVQSGRLVLGTPAFLAPERLLREQSGSPESDLWSLGVLLYRMTTGVNPFVARNPLALMQRVAQSHPVPVSELRTDVPSALTVLTLRLMMKAPSRRAPLDEVRAILAKLNESYRA